jgi:L-seryl-tRNA(Ser) seleniumtransferase
VRVVEVATAEELEAAFGRAPRWSTSSPARTPTRPAQHAGDRRVARQKQVPVLVDAAAEILTVPNVHLENGATLVGYSGGKCLAARRARACCSDARIWCRPRGSTARRITAFAGR